MESSFREAIVIGAPPAVVWETLTNQSQMARWMSGFPTESTFKHLALYWRGTLGVLKDFIERR